MVLGFSTPTERIDAYCLSTGTSVTLSQAHWDLIRARSASLTSTAATIARVHIVGDAPPAPGQPVQFIVGHGYTVNYSTLVP
jgi:hypothetical protein